MIEDAQQIFDYLPVSFRNESEQEYVTFLWETFVTNYENAKYPFAFLAYHMLFMSFVYFEIWQIKNAQREDFHNSLIGFHKDKEAILREAKSPFMLKEIDESVVFRFLKLIGLNNSDIGKCTQLVKDRNNAAHSNGSISHRDQRSLDLKIDEVLRCAEIIQNHSGKTVVQCYKNFLAESAVPENREFIDEEDQIREALIYGNYFSSKDIDVLKGFNHEALRENENYQNILALVEKLREMYPSE